MYPGRSGSDRQKPRDNGKPRENSRPRDNGNREKPSRTISVKNLNPKTLPDTLLSYFNKFGQCIEATLDEDEDGNRTRTATIVFREPPKDTLLIVDHRIDGRLATVEFISNKPYEFVGLRHEKSFLHAQSFSMGNMLEKNHFVEEWSTKSTPSSPIKYGLNYTMRRVTIFFTHLDQDYKVEYRFKDVMGDMMVERENNVTIFTIPLRHPGSYWLQNKKSVSTTSKSIKMGSKWERVALIPREKNYVRPKTKTSILPLTPDEVLDLGNWLVFRLVFRPSRSSQHIFESCLQQAATYNIVPSDLSTHKMRIRQTKGSDLPKPFGHIERVKLGLDFDVLYLLESVISHHYLYERNLTETFYDTLKELEPKISCGMLQLISTTKERIWDPDRYLNDVWDKMEMKIIDNRTIPSHCAMLRKVIITPTQFYVQPLSLETTNRVVRHFKDHTDRFIRVQFMDDGFTKVGSSITREGEDNPTSPKDSIYNRIYEVLRRGIQIGKRRYDFLAFSSSQLREQGCWFFSPSPTCDLNANKIRQWMGVFSHEKVVAKHAIRMGQCFSSTRPVCTLGEKEVEYIDDVKRNGYTFSDGIGKISSSLAEHVAIQMDLKSNPSAFQFRLGGAKGVLTVDKTLDARNIKVQLRPSQIKFESKHLTLEVIRTSTYINGYLNRQVITLLSALGIKDEVFMDFFNRQISDINKLFERPEEAIQVLLGNVDEAGTALSLVPMIQAGFLERNDPYIKNLLNLFRVSILKDLKKKAKIIVPKGAYLLGVMDETATLEPDEVFIQINVPSHSGGVNRMVVTGRCVVFRNPCFHPGDVRIVQAVDKENLHHLQDVIVFPSQGYRDIPSMCSGGDLDGDDYTVFWDNSLIPQRNFPPMDYTGAPPKQVEDEVKIIDILKFFVNYINNDNLGQIANAHLATADQSVNGARDGKCIRLAQLHSAAVDFPKTGIPAKMDDDLKVKRFPDFMDKKDKDTYLSQKVLGRIYRAIDKADYKDYQSSMTAITEYDVRLRVPNMELYIADARELRQKYNRSLMALMNQYGVQTEAEICSGYIIKWLKKGKSKSNYEHHSYTMKAIKSFKATWRAEFEKEFLGPSNTVDPDKLPLLEAKAGAWYYVTYHPHEREKDMSVEGGFLSFPWVVYEYICHIAKKNRSQMDNFDALTPIAEENIKAGKLKLLRMRNDVPIVEVVDEDEQEETEDSSESSDEEIVNVNIYRTPTSVSTITASLDRMNLQNRLPNGNLSNAARIQEINANLPPGASTLPASTTFDQLRDTLLN
ncbi:putative RNA-dependent RNA polymerase SHL2 [Choanephora cucurbitarum]|uniref:RNA-dependent RNA polymerase n=1 Tax=Choanephora cucurbitarum TaxID=101091 RepID=A0A1C7NQG6_9FUNG|nr:putative RNA-dependent RNA polymerase SHL2 [Choanephora cucurbitarum]